MCPRPPGAQHQIHRQSSPSAEGKRVLPVYSGGCKGLEARQLEAQGDTSGAAVRTASYCSDMALACYSAALPTQPRSGTSATHRQRRSRTCSALVCLLLLGRARASSSPRTRRRTGGQVPFHGKKAIAGFVARPAVPAPRGSSTAKGGVGDPSRRVESRNRLRSSRARGVVSMAVSAGLDAEIVSQQSR